MLELQIKNYKNTTGILLEVFTVHSSWAHFKINLNNNIDICQIVSGTLTSGKYDHLIPR